MVTRICLAGTVANASNFMSLNLAVYMARPRFIASIVLLLLTASGPADAGQTQIAALRKPASSCNTIDAKKIGVKVVSATNPDGMWDQE